VTEIVPLLTERPYVLPPLPPEGTSVALVTGDLRDATVVGTGIAAIGPEGLALERALAAFDGSRPDGWILVVEADGGAVRYWAPVRASRFVRDERPVNAGGFRNAVARRPRPVFAVHVPEVTGAPVVFVPVAPAGSRTTARPQVLGRLGGPP
jgi:hypothetical protein